ncbi:MAG: YjbH domain-containing protein, partial [Gammaproteobacteria bacterium]
RLSAGQYLAGDRGVSIDIAKRFDNGLTMGAYATKTNVSSAQFGEGSFDKGIFISIPLDALLPRSSRSVIGFNWSPLTRDGGARLGRAVTLYDLTYARDPDSRSFGPPPDTRPRAGDNILDFDVQR